MDIATIEIATRTTVNLAIMEDGDYYLKFVIPEGMARITTEVRLSPDAMKALVELYPVVNERKMKVRK